jgi:hypothetical protein
MRDLFRLRGSHLYGGTAEDVGSINRPRQRAKKLVIDPDRDMLNQDEQSKAQSARAQEVFTADDLPRRF